MELKVLNTINNSNPTKSPPDALPNARITVRTNWLCLCPASRYSLSSSVSTCPLHMSTVYLLLYLSPYHNLEVCVPSSCLYLCPPVSTCLLPSLSFLRLFLSLSPPLCLLRKTVEALSACNTCLRLVSVSGLLSCCCLLLLSATAVWYHLLLLPSVCCRRYNCFSA